MSKFKYRNDGSIDIEPDFPLTSSFLKRWRQDPQDCRHFILNFPDCRFRILETTRLDCGKLIFDYNCNKYNCKTSIDNCNKCVKENKAGG